MYSERFGGKPELTSFKMDLEEGIDRIYLAQHKQNCHFMTLCKIGVNAELA
jgi:hypothetical protein